MAKADCTKIDRLLVHKIQKDTEESDITEPWVKKEGYKNEKYSFLDPINDGNLILWLQHRIQLWFAWYHRQCNDQFEYTPPVRNR